MCVTDALEEISDFHPTALDGIIVGVEDVPHFSTDWSGGHVPMSAALEPTRGRRAQIVVYERPLEHRAGTRQQLRDLVHRTIVEQLSMVTGIAVEQLTDRDLDDD